MASRSRARSASPSSSRTSARQRKAAAKSQPPRSSGEPDMEAMVASFGGIGRAVNAVAGLSAASGEQLDERIARAEALMMPEARDCPPGPSSHPPAAVSGECPPQPQHEPSPTPSPPAAAQAPPSPGVAPLPFPHPLTRENRAELEAIIAKLGGCERAPDLIEEVRAAEDEGDLVEVDGVDIDAVLTRLGGYDRALDLIEAVHAAKAAALGLTLDENGRYWLPSGERATHPDHGPMDKVPRHDDGTISTYYYCSKRELSRVAVAPPVRRQRDDGWTTDIQTRFINILADSGSVTRACDAVRRSRTSAYRLRREPSAREFARAWDEALASTTALLAETALDRAVNGQEEKVFYKGQCVGHRVRYDNRLLMAMLRARDPLNYAPIDELERWEGRRPGPQSTVIEMTERLRLSENRWGQMDRAELDALTAPRAPSGLTDGRTPERVPAPAPAACPGEKRPPEPPALL